MRKLYSPPYCSTGAVFSTMLLVPKLELPSPKMEKETVQPRRRLFLRCSDKKNATDMSKLNKVVANSVNDVLPADEEFAKWWSTHDSDAVIGVEDVGESSGFSSSVRDDNFDNTDDGGDGRVNDAENFDGCAFDRHN
jgi:hypothetical protein